MDFNFSCHKSGYSSGCNCEWVNEWGTQHYSSKLKITHCGHCAPANSIELVRALLLLLVPLTSRKWNETKWKERDNSTYALGEVRGCGWCSSRASRRWWELAASEPEKRGKCVWLRFYLRSSPLLLLLLLLLLLIDSSDDQRSLARWRAQWTRENKKDHSGQKIYFWCNADERES